MVHLKGSCISTLTDTDTLMYKIETENVNEDLYKDKELFDFNNCPKDSKY